MTRGSIPNSTAHNSPVPLRRACVLSLVSLGFGEDTLSPGRETGSSGLLSPTLDQVPRELAEFSLTPVIKVERRLGGAGVGRSVVPPLTPQGGTSSSALCSWRTEAVVTVPARNYVLCTGGESCTGQHQVRL